MDLKFEDQRLITECKKIIYENAINYAKNFLDSNGYDSARWLNIVDSSQKAIREKDKKWFSKLDKIIKIKNKFKFEKNYLGYGSSVIFLIGIDKFKKDFVKTSEAYLGFGDVQMYDLGNYYLARDYYILGAAMNPNNESILFEIISACTQGSKTFPETALPYALMLGVLNRSKLSEIDYVLKRIFDKLHRLEKAESNKTGEYLLKLVKLFNRLSFDTLLDSLKETAQKCNDQVLYEEINAEIDKWKYSAMPRAEAELREYDKEDQKKFENLKKQLNKKWWQFWK